MVPARFAYVVARLHKWLGLIVGVQLLIWTVTGFYFTLTPIDRLKGEHLWAQPASQAVDLSRVTISMEQALAAVAEDRPIRTTLRMLGDQPVYEIEAEIGVFLVSAVDGAILSPLSEDLARETALAVWRGGTPLTELTLLEEAPHEAGGAGPVWAARFEGPGNRVLYIRANNGQVGPARIDVWRIYDFFWSLHIMDYSAERENFNHPLIMAAAVTAISLVLFGFVLLLHRFTRRALS